MTSRREIILDGGPPWGFRMQGGADTGQPLKIIRVNPGSRASQLGVREGDIIAAIDDQPTDNIAISDAHAMLRKCSASAAVRLSLINPASSCSSPKRRHSNKEVTATNGCAQQPSQPSAEPPATQEQDGNSNRVEATTNGHVEGVTGSDDSVGVTSFSLLDEIESALAAKGDSVWSPGQQRRPLTLKTSPPPDKDGNGAPSVPRWSPATSPAPERRIFRPVNFQPQASISAPPTPPAQVTPTSESPTPTSSAPASLTSHLPRAPNPTITLLQKAREGRIPRLSASIPGGPSQTVYVDHKMSVVDGSAQQFDVKPTVQHHQQQRRPVEGIGPITKDGMPIVLRSGVREENKGQWYRRMYDSLHRQHHPLDTADAYVTIRYRPGGGRKAPYSSTYGRGTGYQSEPETSDDLERRYLSNTVIRRHDAPPSSKYATLDRRRLKQSGPQWNEIDSAPRVRSVSPANYRPRPGKIENYEPGLKSSISQQEEQEWWEDTMKIFEEAGASKGELPPSISKKQNSVPTGHIGKQLAGYESDTTLVMKKRETSPSPVSATTEAVEEKRLMYRDVQKGGEVPFTGLRKKVPEKQKETPHRFNESEVTIHYKSPVRTLEREKTSRESEEEERRRQEAHMKRIYEEDRRRKFYAEIDDLERRRHTDNFTPKQKSPIPLNRYDEWDGSEDTKPSWLKSLSDSKTCSRYQLARAMYEFVAQSNREVSFCKGDMLLVTRRIDANWFEGERRAGPMNPGQNSRGIFPIAYVELVRPTPGSTNVGFYSPWNKENDPLLRPGIATAVAKYDFHAQTPLELNLVRGQAVTVIRRVDDNWFEGRSALSGSSGGIFPVSYVDLIDSDEPPEKPMGSPASHSLVIPHSDSSSTRVSHHQFRPDDYSGYRGTPSAGTHPCQKPITVDTKQETGTLYRAVYTYAPQHDDELALREGDVVRVTERCDDGWYVGISHRTGLFGTFPGNYVEKL